MDYRSETPEIISAFLTYHENIKNHSPKTIDEYYLDLRTFFRFMKRARRLVSDDLPFDEISILDIDLDFVKSITLSDIYSFLTFLSRERDTANTGRNAGGGLAPATRARKIAAIRSFYKYLTNKEKVLDENPIADLDSPKLRKSLPRYLSMDESLRLLEAVDGVNQERDYCILTLFLNCGLRISELTGLNLTDISDDHLRVLGKGNKERVVYLNAACIEAIDVYKAKRKLLKPKEPKAFFISRNGNRMSRSAVHDMVKKTLLKANIDPASYSSHKLRHTAATLMLQNGVDVRTLQEVLGHDHLNTTQIYTHVDSTELRTAARANPLGSVKKKK